MKFKITLKFKVKGPVDKNDIIGSIFNNTRDILPINLENLIKQKKISKLKVLFTKKDKEVEGFVYFYSDLSKRDNSLLIALIEQVNKVANFRAFFNFYKFEDLTKKIKEKIEKRAEEILNEIEGSNLVFDKIIYPKNINKFDEIILVEGKKDAENLFKSNIRNVIALNGNENIEEKVNLLKKLLKNKKIVLFFDNDGGGKFLIRLLKDKLNFQYIALPRKGQKVEEMTKKEIIESLKNKINVEKIKDEIKKAKIIEEIIKNQTKNLNKSFNFLK